jgi:acyl carrier protein
MVDNTETTAVQSDNFGTVTDSATPVDNTATDTKSEQGTTPQVEMRDGKLFVDGVRVYSRDDTNKIAANAKKEAESRFLSELNVDSLDSVKSVVRTLQDTGVAEEGSTLNVSALRDAVKKREATVEELTAQVNSLKTDLLLKDHMSNLTNAMPGNWTPDQRAAVVDLMRARNMLAVEGDTFAIRNGDSYLTVDGEKPDYAGAVELVGRTLGLQFGKKGVELQLGETGDISSSTRVKLYDASRVNTDAEYRAAYMNIRQYQPMLKREAITDAMVKKQIEKTKAQFK